MSAGPGPNVVYKTEILRAESRERGECDQSGERMVGSGWAALGSLRHIALHYGRKHWARRSFSIFSANYGFLWMLLDNTSKLIFEISAQKIW